MLSNNQGLPEWKWLCSQFSDKTVVLELGGSGLENRY